MFDKCGLPEAPTVTAAAPEGVFFMVVVLIKSTQGVLELSMFFRLDSQSFLIHLSTELSQLHDDKKRDGQT